MGKEYKLYWTVSRIVTLIIGLTIMGTSLIGWLVYTTPAIAATSPKVIQIIEREQEHAWCYVLVNKQNKIVGDIHTLACVPKE